MPAIPDPDLATLIAQRKGDRSYERLASDCGGDPKPKRIQQLATSELLRFPEPGTIRGLSRGLLVPISDVVLACARSLGLPAHGHADPGALVIGSVLSEHQKEVLANLAREFMSANITRAEADLIATMNRLILFRVQTVADINRHVAQGDLDRAEAARAAFLARTDPKALIGDIEDVEQEYGIDLGRLKSIVTREHAIEREIFASPPTEELGPYAHIVSTEGPGYEDLLREFRRRNPSGEAIDSSGSMVHLEAADVPTDDEVDKPTRASYDLAARKNAEGRVDPGVAAAREMDEAGTGDQSPEVPEEDVPQADGPDDGA